MFKINQPAMALNADDVPGATYKMWNTWQVPASSTPDHTLGWTATVARSAPGGYQITLIINCHGFYDEGSNGKLVGGFGLALGTGIRMGDTPKFSILAPFVSCIVITACGAARISGKPKGDGHAFCSSIAVYSKAYVIAATTHQDGDLWLPFGYVDDFEGLVVRYNPAGNIDWSGDYGRNFIDGYFHGYD
jgi:hypothetical protein